MKKIIYIIFLLLLIGCEKKENKIFVSKEVTTNLFKVEKIIEKIYSNKINIKYKILGEGKAKEKILINGEELMIPIYTNLTKNKEIKINMGVIYNFNNKESHVVIDGLLVKFNEFQKIIEKSNDWIEKTKRENLGKNILEKKIWDNSVKVLLPQGKKIEFDVFFIFDNKNNKLIFIEKGNGNKMKIKFSEKDIKKINKGLEMERLENVILENILFLKEKLIKIEKSYKKLNYILK